MSQLNVDIITARDGQGAPSFSKGAVVTGVATATTFKGNLEGNVTGNVTGDASGSSGSCTGNAATATVATNAQGLTGTPSITVQDITGVGATFTGNVSIGGTLTYEDVTNIDSVGIVTARAGVFIPDNYRLELGNAAGSGDLQIYHDGSESRIKDAGTGGLYLQASRGGLINVAASKWGVLFEENSWVKLFHDGNAKLETTDTGAVVTGILTATTLVGRLENVPASNKTAAYTAVKEDAGTIIRTNNASGVTINQNIFASGDIISVYNNSGGNISIVQGTGVTLRLVGTSTTGTRTLALRGLVTVTCVSSNEFVCSGGGLS